MSSLPPGRRNPASRGLPPAQRAMWDRLYASDTLGKLPWAIQRPFPPLVDAVEAGWIRPPGPILDVGCGLGANTFWLAAHAFRVTGVDVATGAITAAETRRSADKRNPTFIVDDLLASGLPPRKFKAAIDVGCFQTLPPRLRGDFARGAHRVLAPAAPYLLFWVAREERGSWGPPHRLSVGDVLSAFEPWFRVERIVHRPRNARLTRETMRSQRPLATLAGYSALMVRRASSQPPAM